MKKYLLIILLLSFIAEISFADSAWVYFEGTSHYYKRIDTWMTWNEAKLNAESLGGYLATVTSDPENYFIWNTLLLDNENPFAMLGGFQLPDSLEPDLEWQWVTGEEWSYTNWAPDQPDDALGGQDYLTFAHNTSGDEGLNGMWDDDFIDTKSYPSIVESLTPEPATFLLLGLGGLVLRRRRK